MSKENLFYINDTDWASELCNEYEDYIAYCESQAFDDEVDVETVSGEYFCGCQTCYTREQLMFLVPRIIKAYNEGKLSLSEEETNE
jgi:hypothetical protein